MRNPLSDENTLYLDFSDLLAIVLQYCKVLVLQEKQGKVHEMFLFLKWHVNLQLP